MAAGADASRFTTRKGCLRRCLAWCSLPAIRSPFFTISPHASSPSTTFTSTTLLAPRSSTERKPSDWVLDTSLPGLEEIVTVQPIGACSTAKTCHGELSSGVRVTMPLDPSAQHEYNALLCPYGAIYLSSLTRAFSTFLARAKEKPPGQKPAPEESIVDEEEEDKSEKSNATSSRRGEESNETGEKPPLPTPIPNSTPTSGRPNSSSGAESNPGGGDSVRKGRRSSPAERSLQKPTVPEIYPQVMAIPIAKRPLFPGFYKAVTIRDPNVASAIQEMMKRGQPYIGAFLFKDENADQDTIENLDDVHSVGVFAQITSAFPVHGEDNSLTAVLYPHRRIKMTNLIPPTRGKDAPTGRKAESQSVIEVEPAESATTAEDPTQERKGDVVASFEEGVVDHQSRDTGTQQYEPTSFLRKYPVSLVSVENLTEEPHDKKSPVIRAVTSEIVNVFKEVANLNPLFRDQISTFSMSQSAGNVIDEPAKLADFAAAVSAGEIKELQDVLETLSVEERLSKALVVLKKELMNAQLQSKISKDVEAKIQKRQREYWLMEQMKGIRRELGIESDGKDKLVEKFREKAEKLAMPEAVKKVFDEEINKLAHLEPAASEFNVTRNYLDWLTQIPWGQRSPENFGISNAMKVLDEDHYGLKDVKDRILEFVAVGKLRGSVEGKILCFVGPPGVGKTSIGKSIARALNRQYYRFSVGGLTDVAEIKGHRRTYVGALPGRIIQALKKCQTENPLILIDEIDKIGRGHQGDPASALLELLDPEQNNSFLDHYMDVPVDLSKVLFVCTANMSDTIPRPLLDRMETIELSGYVADEKMAIAERYLAPAAKEMSGLKDVNVQLQKSAIEELIKSYCRESGVRNLKKQIEKVFRKSALRIVQDLGESVPLDEKVTANEGKPTVKEEEVGSDIKETPSSIGKANPETLPLSLNVPDSVQVDITKDSLKDYVGPPIFTSDRLYDITPPGVAMGLAWTRMGGAALYVESILEAALSPSSQPGFERTGNLKSVMKESTSIAYSFAKSLMAKDFSSNKFFEKARLHLHCPEGAVQKDGPSAGITMATSLLSLALDHRLDPTIAMTGELTVTGKVLRIGGLREKAVAARRAGAKKIIFPADNMSDWLELPANIKEGLEGHPASWYSDVFDLVFSDLDKEHAATVWKAQLTEASGKSGGEEVPKP
ncbi:MAG: ATP-dependent Lon protease pim1 [Geoglossum simile]|nr:MAG: ATP-dependent Lon protease pim1 [Geoglossum simile]